MITLLLYCAGSLAIVGLSYFLIQSVFRRRQEHYEWLEDCEFLDIPANDSED